MGKTLEERIEAARVRSDSADRQASALGSYDLWSLIAERAARQAWDEYQALLASRPLE